MASEKTVNMTLTEREVNFIAAAIACKQASVSRAHNAAGDLELRAIYQRQSVEYADLRRKFGG